jgi:hypothetical protein
MRKMSEGKITDDSGQKRNFRTWSNISSVMIGATLTILALIWSFSTTGGIITSSILLLVSFSLFVNATTINEKIIYEIGKGTEEKYVNRWISFAEYSFGLGFTLEIISFAILGYKYIYNYLSPGDTLFSLILPIIFLASVWCIMIIYNILNAYDKSYRFLRSAKRNTWLIIEAIALVFIILDYCGILSIN